MFVKNGPFKFVDNGNAKELEHNYFVAIRSSYLTLCQGGKLIIKSYSPHRFGRQFGYSQDIPWTLKYDTCAASLEERLYYWRLCILAKSLSKAWFSCLPTNAKKLCSEAYNACGGIIERVFCQIDAYDEAKFLSYEKLFNSLLDQQLKEAKDRLQDAQVKASEEVSKVQSTTTKLEHTEREIVDLKEQRTSLYATLKRQNQLDHGAQAKVYEIEEDIVALENTTLLNDAIVGDLESLRANLEVLKKDLKSLNPFA
ncbi:UNVERIFIED_CONTAM: hypothetical protein Scaly_2432900 [Sesamum calycinum]|uniref:Uncharacterized protein n=1 Tax=Sesamum calycinum TaxID=2727403 RepID=A0AAW2M0N2_9LAMI